jgi:hypothetical protein
MEAEASDSKSLQAWAATSVGLLDQHHTHISRACGSWLATAWRVPAGISKAKLKKVFEKLDADGSGELDKEEFSHYKGEMDREATIGRIIAKELPADLVLLMKEQGSSPTKVERAASSLERAASRKRRHGAQGDLTNLFEVSAAKSAPTQQKPQLLARYGVFDRAESRRTLTSYVSPLRPINLLNPF